MLPESIQFRIQHAVPQVAADLKYDLSLCAMRRAHRRPLIL